MGSRLERAEEIPGAVVIEPRVFGDTRGFFFELWNASASLGLPTTWVQDNVSSSQRGVLRGLHLQHPGGQGKLVTVLEGEVWDVGVDLRVGSPTFGAWAGVVLDGTTHRQVFWPRGIAHGFVVRSERALFHYKCDAPYDPTNECNCRNPLARCPS